MLAFKMTSFFGLWILLIFQGSSAQKFTFPALIDEKETHFNVGDGNLSVTGTVELTQEDMLIFQPKIELQMVTKLCSVDLSSCESDVSLKTPSTCHCVKRSGDVFTVHFGTASKQALSKTSLEAIIPSNKGFEPIKASVTLGNIPSVFEAPTPLVEVCLKEKIGIGSSYHLVVRSDGKSVLCDMNLDGGKWTIIQRRSIGDLDFDRDWQQYVDGFGEHSGDFWYGLDNIHELCSKAVCELKFHLQYKGKSYFANYQKFVVLGEKDNFKMSVSGYSGTAPDDFSHHNGMQFTTKDRDHDNNDRNCAIIYPGGWWYKSCYLSHPTGKWGSKVYGHGVVWRYLTTEYDSLTFTEMLVRPIV